jgi:Helix-turn-helix domain
MALVVLSVVERWLDAVRAVLSGESVVEVAARYEVARSTLHRWVARYLEGSVAGLADRSHRPLSCPHQVEPSWRRQSRRSAAGIRGGVRNGSEWSCCGGCRRPGRSGWTRRRIGR